MDFTTELNQLMGNDQPFTAAGLTFLSDISSADRSTLALMWPGIDLARRRRIVKTLVQVAEDNIEYNFYGVFTAVLEDPDAEVRRVAVEGLAEDESMPTLRRVLSLLETDPDPEVRAAAAVVLAPAALRAETGKLKGDWPDRLRNALLAAARSPASDEEIRRRALEAVAYFGGDVDVESEIKRAYTGSPLVRASALHAMGRTMNPVWAPILVHEVQNKDPLMRFEAAQALGELGETANVPALLPLLEDHDVEVRLAAIWALGELGGRVALQALQGLSADADEVIREAVDEAITEIRFASDPLAP